MVLKRRPAKAAASTVGESARPAVPGVTAAAWSQKLIARLKTLKGVIVAVAGVGAVLGGLAGYWNAYLAAHGGAHSSSLLAMVGTGDAGPLSIVVLPFTNLTGDPQQAYVADGLTAAVTSDLSRIRDAFIVSGATALAYRDKPVTAQQVGKELGVRFALQGSVQRDHDKIRINAQLSDTTTNGQLWSETFDGAQADLFALQDLVTTRIGNSIGREMVVLAARDSEKRRSDSKVADLMLRARALALKPLSPENYEGRQALCRQVLLLDPGNVQAMVALASALSSPVDGGFIADPVVSEKQLEEARYLALKAKELDPGIADVYVVLGVYALHHGDLEGARRASATALSLDPKNPARYNSVAAGYLYVADPVRAIELLTQAVRLDPRHVNDLTIYNMGYAQIMAGNDDAAIAWLLKALDTSPANTPALTSPLPLLAVAYARKGDVAQAQIAVAALLRAEPNYSFSRYEAPRSWQPAAFREFWEKKLQPAGRLAGLPE